MNDKLEEIEQRYVALQNRLAEPEVMNDRTVYRETMKSVREIEDVVAKYRELKQVRKGLAETREMLTTLKGEDDLRELAQMELAELEAKQPVLENDLRVL